MTYAQIQAEVIAKYHVDICDGSKCQNDWRRTHAHVKERRVCKWKQANSIQSTFTLLHEVGHIETTKSSMRRAESEYFATAWAIARCKEYGLEVPEAIRKLYQDYIDREKDRGQRRGGTGYGNLQLDWGDEQAQASTCGKTSRFNHLRLGIKYEKEGQYYTQLFLTEKAMQQRVQELARNGYNVTILKL